MAEKIPREGAKNEPKSAARPVRARTPSQETVINEHIGSQLKAIYDQVVSQPIPDRLLALLSRLDDKAGKQ